jgi:hypothetical protein
VERSDGKSIRLGDNVWLTHRVIRKAGLPEQPEDFVHIFDIDSTGSYTLTYEPAPAIPGAPLLGTATATTVTIVDLAVADQPSTQYALYEETSRWYVGPEGLLRADPYWQGRAAWQGVRACGLAPSTEYRLRCAARSASGEETALGATATARTSRQGDMDGDNLSDVVDLLLLVDSFGLTWGEPEFNAACDLNNDGSVDVVDLLYLVENFGT